MGPNLSIRAVSASSLPKVDAPVNSSPISVRHQPLKPVPTASDKTRSIRSSQRRKSAAIRSSSLSSQSAPRSSMNSSLRLPRWTLSCKNFISVINQYIIAQKWRISSFILTLDFLENIGRTARLMATMQTYLSSIMSSVRSSDKINSTDRVSSLLFNHLSREKMALSSSLAHLSLERRTHCMVKLARSAVSSHEQSKTF